MKYILIEGIFKLNGFGNKAGIATKLQVLLAMRPGRVQALSGGTPVPVRQPPGRSIRIR